MAENNGHSEEEKLNQEVMKELMKILQNPDNELKSVITGRKNEVVPIGTSMIQDMRVTSGPLNRLLVGLQQAANYEVDGKRVNTAKYVTYIALSTKGFSKEIPDHGQRGEAIEMYSKAIRPRKEDLPTPQPKPVEPANQPQGGEQQ